jgi:shikimate kinase
MPKHITLIGMMGSGKSTVAPLIAAPLKRPVLEVDKIIEEQEGMSINEIFIAKGEAWFRRAESELLASLLRGTPAVISPGGGAFQWEATRNLLLKNTVVFYLYASEEILASRLQNTLAARPLLNAPGLDVRDTIREILLRRGANYDLAHYRVDTSSHAPHDVAKAVLMMREAYD